MNYPIEQLEELRQRLAGLLREAELSPDEKEQRDIVAKLYPRNPFIAQSRANPPDFTIGFKKPPNYHRVGGAEALWWTGEGFKNLGTVRDEPEVFETKAAAEKKIRSEILDHIRKWRTDQVHLIIGW